MKYKVSNSVIEKAYDYAVKSEPYTYKHPGYESTKKEAQIKRITTGKIAEYWTDSYCKEIGIMSELDETDYTRHDNHDIIINGVTVDCKSSNNKHCSCQVQYTHDKRNWSQSPGEYYSFYYIENNKFIYPIGFIEKEWLIESSDKVKKGCLIRSSGLRQQFDNYSYFIRNSESLINFELFVKNGMKHK